jgi:(2Fe-2S) ferredoxin
MGKDYMTGEKIKTPFTAVGQFLRYAIADGYKIKGIFLSTADGVIRIKLPKELRSTTSAEILQPGAWIWVSGQRTIDFKSNREKLKAHSIQPLAAMEGGERGSRVIPVDPIELPPPPLACIRVCQKSSCCKRGGRLVWNALESALVEAGLSDTVRLEGGKCMGHCKVGPNVVVLPDKSRYSGVNPHQVTALLERHFGVSKRQPISATV